MTDQQARPTQPEASDADDQLGITQFHVEHIRRHWRTSERLGDFESIELRLVGVGGPLDGMILSAWLRGDRIRTDAERRIVSFIDAVAPSTPPPTRPPSSQPGTSRGDRVDAPAAPNLAPLGCTQDGARRRRWWEGSR